MKSVKKLIFYIVVTGGFTLLVFLILHLGSGLEVYKKIPAGKSETWNAAEFLLENITHPLAILLLQIVTIILIARFFSWICKKIDQPVVIGEIAAGIVLGPSLLGLYLPDVFSALFPTSSLSNLQFLSQIGLILFMFVVGMELDIKVLKNQAREAIIISHASIIIPFTLGTGLAYFMYKSFAPADVTFISFSLFMGISMSITAFPVLARIVQERGMHKSKVGTIAITCAAIDDITAWSLLAMVIAIVNAGSLASSLMTMSLAILYVLIALLLVKPFLKRISELHPTSQNLSKSEIAIFFLVLIGSSYLTEIIGIHALFGAFMAGVIMPDNQRFKQVLIEKIEDIALVLLLPLFFVYTGLRTEIGLLNDVKLWSVFCLILIVAVTGKFGGSAIAARFVGQSWKDSLTVGALMNTRGLVELVALNIGYDLGVLSPEVFTMLVLMALITTIMTAPALSLINRFSRKEAPIAVPVGEAESRLRILISFGNPEMGRILFRMINKFANGLAHIRVTALHLFTGNLFTRYKLDEIERDSFLPILNESKKTGLPVETIFKITDDITDEIITESRNGYDLLLIGIGQSIYEGSALGRILGVGARFFNPSWLLRRLRPLSTPVYYIPDQRTYDIVNRCRIPAGILINRNLSEIRNILVIHNDNSPMEKFLSELLNNKSIHISYCEQSSLSGTILQGYDLLIVSLQDWSKLNHALPLNLSSVLILKV